MQPSLVLFCHRKTAHLPKLGTQNSNAMRSKQVPLTSFDVQYNDRLGHNQSHLPWKSDNQICMSDIKVVEQISTHGTLGRKISDTVQHLAKFWQGYNIWDKWQMVFHSILAFL